MEHRTRTGRLGRTAVAVAAGLTGALLVGPTPARAAGPVVVSLTFDDGLTSQYQLAPTLAAHNVKGTFYLNTGRVPATRAGRMTWADAEELAAAGHEIGGHTLDHVSISGSTLTDAEKVRQVCADRAQLWQHGFAAASFAYPEGGSDARATAIAQQCGYLNARLAGKLVPTGTNPAYVVDTVPPVEGAYGIRVLGTSENGPMTLEFLQSSVQAVYDKGGGWLPMLFHRVCYAGTADYAACMASYRPVDAAVIDQFLTWATAQGSITFRTISEVLHGTANPVTSAPPASPPPSNPPPTNPPPTQPPRATSPKIWSLSRDAAGQWQQRNLLSSRLSISSFGEDPAGELYVVDLGGGIYRVTAGASAG